MTTSAQIAALVRSHMDRDEDRFRAIVKQIAAHSGGRLASDLERILQKVPPGAPLLMPLPHDVAGLLTQAHASVPFSEMVLGEEERRAIGNVLTEQRHRSRLLEHGLHPARKLLLYGPPGVGKSMTAAVLATELKIPLVRVNLHAVIASHLGETAAHLRKVFDHVGRERAVYLFDEFDALGAARGTDSNDVAEMRRVLNSLLQFIEDDASESVIIGATNLPEILDRALYRRFDVVIEYKLPTIATAKDLIARHSTEIDLDYVATHATSFKDGIQIGHADIIAACRATAKQVVLGDAMPYSGTPSDLLVRHLDRRMRTSP